MDKQENTGVVSFLYLTVMRLMLEYCIYSWYAFLLLIQDKVNGNDKYLHKDKSRYGCKRTH